MDLTSRPYRKNLEYWLSIVRLFFIDNAKQVVLTVVIGVPLIYLLLGIIEWGGEHFYFYVFSFMVAFNLLMMHIFPNYIQPLFNTYKELDKESTLRSKIEQLAQRLNFPLKKILVVD